MRDLGRVTELVLAQNPLPELPLSICDMPALKALNVSGCGKKSTSSFTLPDCLGRLTQLTCLEVNACGLAKIPGSIAKLTQLRHFSAQCNKLTKVWHTGANAFTEQCSRFSFNAVAHRRPPAYRSAGLPL